MSEITADDGHEEKVDHILIGSKKPNRPLEVHEGELPGGCAPISFSRMEQYELDKGPRALSQPSSQTGPTAARFLD